FGRTRPANHLTAVTLSEEGAMNEEQERSPIERSKTEPEGRAGQVEPRHNGAVDSLIGATERVVTPFARAGWRGARGIARRLGVDRRVGDAAESGTARALDSDTAARATERVLDNETAKQVWAKVLESDEAQQLVERVAEAPELRAAIASQGV